MKECKCPKLCYEMSDCVGGCENEVKIKFERKKLRGGTIQLKMRYETNDCFTSYAQVTFIPEKEKEVLPLLQEFIKKIQDENKS